MKSLSVVALTGVALTGLTGCTLIAPKQNTLPSAFASSARLVTKSGPQLGNFSLPITRISNDELYAHQERDRQILDAEYTKADDYATAELNKLSEIAQGHSDANVAVVGAGLLSGIASTVMTAANPAKWAGWIAGTTGFATGTLTYRSARGLEGFSAIAISEQYTRVQNEIASARTEYAAARIAMEENFTPQNWNKNYQRAKNAIDRVRSAGQLKGIALGKTSDNEAITQLMKGFLEEMKIQRDALTAPPTKKQQATSEYVDAIAVHKKASDELTAATAAKVSADKDVTDAKAAVAAAQTAFTAATAAIEPFKVEKPKPPATPEDEYKKWEAAKKVAVDAGDAADKALKDAQSTQDSAEEAAKIAADTFKTADDAAKAAEKQEALTKAVLDSIIALELSQQPKK